MAQDLTGKTAVITGAGGGIGRAIALRLAQEKMNVVLFGGNNLEKLDETRRQVEAIGAKCLELPGDLTDVSRHEAMLKTAVQTFGGIDALVNNAGMTASSSVAETPVELFDKIMAINVRAPYFLTQAAQPFLKQSACGTIINVISVVGHAGYPLQSAYAASKHALLGFTKSLSAEVYTDGIRVHAISPGGVFTDMVKISRPDLTPDGMIMPEDIAEIAAFFLIHRGNAVVDEIQVHRVNKQPFLT